MVLFKLKIAGVLLFALKNYVYEWKDFLEHECRAVKLWGHSSVITQ